MIRRLRFRPAPMLLFRAAAMLLPALASAPGAARAQATAADPPRPPAWDVRAVRQILEAEAGGILDAGTPGLDAAGRRLLGDSPGRLSLTDVVMDDPVRSPQILEALALRELSLLDRPALLLADAAARQDHPAPRTLVGDPTAAAWARAAGPAPLFDAIARCYEDGRRLSGKERDDLRRLAERVPPAVQRLAAALLHASFEAGRWPERAFRDTEVTRRGLGGTPFSAAARAWIDSLDTTPDAAVRARLERAAGQVDFGALNAGAVELAAALARAAAEVESLEAGPGAAFTWDTPMGRVAVGGAGPDRYRGGHLLILDFGGDDTYEGAGGVDDPSRPVSLVLDRSGNDTYGIIDSSSCGPAGAIGGYAYLADLAGDDDYRSWRIGLGAAVFGAALLWDRAGADSSDSFAFGQGAALYGLALLADGAGDDRYRIVQGGQGFGAPGGVGWLLDGAGHDDYRAVNEPLIVPSAQRRDRNTSLAQGCGTGFRADILDGHSLAGGFGLLADGTGDDRYESQVFGAASGYWHALGALYDGAGDDAYRTAWYGLGAAAHFAAGLLLDRQGNDTYEAALNMALGAGHDLSVGVAVDAGGDDRYRGPNLSLGAGNDQGFGLFVDMAGSDRYDVTAAGSGFACLGAARTDARTGLRSALHTTGIFLDLSGIDGYGAAPGGPAGDGLRWSRRDTGPGGGERRQVSLDRGGAPQ